MQIVFMHTGVIINIYTDNGELFIIVLSFIQTPSSSGTS